MLQRTEVHKVLKNVDQQICCAFAARCALRVLPSLPIPTNFVTNRKQFWFSEDYLLAVLTAQRISYLSGVGLVGRNIVSDAVRSAYAARVAHVDVRAVVHAAVRAANYDHHHAVVDAAAVTAAYSIEVAGESNIALQHDLDRIRKGIGWFNLNQKITATDLLYAPLWPENSTPLRWQENLTRFKEALHDQVEDFGIWADWCQDRIDSKPLNLKQEKFWLNVPEEVKAQGAKAVNAYLASWNKVKLQPLNLVRAIFIGNGAAGKTSLIRCLHDKPVVEGKEKMTPGIEISEWPVGGTEIKARFWDFGGQVMSHSTHQFFLRERCLYILVLDARTDFNANDQAEYWLEHVKAFGNNAPVMLVGNKSDLTAVMINMNTLWEKYPNVIGFYPISCLSKEKRFIRNFENFREDLISHLTDVGTHQVMFNDNEFTVLQAVRECSRESAFLPHCKFDELCQQNDIGKVGLDKEDFLGLLDSLGEVIHFPNLSWAEDYVLNPRWLTYGVYTLLYAAKTGKQKGRLSESDVVEILQAKTVEDEQGNPLIYPKNKCRFIVDAMSEFKLSYCLPEDHTQFVIPDKLPSEQPDLAGCFDKAAEGTLAVEFDFKGLLPRNVMPNLIVERHREIVKNQKDQSLEWQQGVILDNTAHQARARLQVDYHQRLLQIWVQGYEPKEFLLILRDEVYKILDNIKGLAFEELVILPLSARIERDDQRVLNLIDRDKIIEKATFKRLLNEAREGNQRITSDAGNLYDLSKVLGLIMTDEQQKKEGITVTQNFNAPTQVAAQSFGEKSRASGNIYNQLSQTDRREFNELSEALGTVMKHIQSHDADFEVKADAYSELKSIRQHIEAISAGGNPEQPGKLLSLLKSIKDGSSGALQLAKNIQEADEARAWLMEKAVTVSALLAVIGL